MSHEQNVQDGPRHDLGNSTHSFNRKAFSLCSFEGSKLDGYQMQGRILYKNSGSTGDSLATRFFDGSLGSL